MQRYEEYCVCSRNILLNMFCVLIFQDTNNDRYLRCIITEIEDELKKYKRI